MDLKLDKKHENMVTFVADVPVSLANLIRRYSMVRVPILAIDNVILYENSSALFDEYISHRMGLLPIITPEKTSDKTEVTFRLDETGPKVVYSKDLQSSDKEIIPGRGEIPIITLTDGQRLRLEAVAKVGLGLRHSKFQAGLVSYSQEEKGVRFLVESFYQMPPAQVILRGCDVLEADLKGFARQLEKSEKPAKAAKKKKK